MSDDTDVRLAVIEVQIKSLIEEMEKRDKKIDELLALKNRGLGAIWLVTLIFGSSLIAGLATVISWFKG